MIRQIRVSNFAIVEDGVIQLDQGMTCFTGETGAGKTLLLEAIGLLLGSKASSDLVKEGKESAEVEGLFDLYNQAHRLEFIKNLGFDMDDSTDLIVRREIAGSDAKKNRIWIQGKIATRKQLQEILGDWIEISGQHEFLKLGNSEYLLNTLDQFAGLKTDVANYSKDYLSYVATLGEFNRLNLVKHEHESKLDFLKFQVDELKKAGITEQLAEQEKQLIETRNKLGSVEKIRETSAHAISILEGDETQSGILPQTQALTREIRSLDKLGPEFSNLLRISEEAEALLRELNYEVLRLTQSIEADPDALEAAEEQLSQLSRLKRKHQKDTQGLVDLKNNLIAQIHELECSDSRLDEIQKTLSQQKTLLDKQAQKLFDARKSSAALFEQKWQMGVRELGMTHARVHFALSKKTHLNESGGVDIDVFFSANPGTKIMPLSKIASGGELSRLLLSLKHIVAGKSEVGVYLFDEVDTGIGGKTAQIVGERLRMISASNQVLVVSHLPQIAARANHHFLIEKALYKGRMQTKIRELNTDDRTLELARMLGDPNSSSAQKLAKEMLHTTPGTHLSP